MRRGYGISGFAANMGLLIAATTFVGCGQQAPTVVQAPATEQSPATVYDADHRDNHRWDDREARAYTRWETENNRPHQEFAKRQGNDQSEYWNWRHSHPDTSNDRH